MRCDQHTFHVTVSLKVAMFPWLDIWRFISFKNWCFGLLLLECLRIWLQSWRGQISVTAQSYRIIPNNPQLIQDGQSSKEDVADERNDSQLPVQLPSVNMNGYKKEDDGKEECAGNEDESGAVDLYGVAGVHEGGLDEPGQAQAQHVKNIRAHNVGHGHVGFPWWAQDMFAYWIYVYIHTQKNTKSLFTHSSWWKVTGGYLLWPPSHWPRCQVYWFQLQAEWVPLLCQGCQGSHLCEHDTNKIRGRALQQH